MNLAPIPSPRRTSFALAVLILLLAARPAAAQFAPATADDRYGFTFAGGFSHPDAGQTPGVHYHDGFYFDFETDFRLRPGEPLWLGVGFNTAYYDGDQRFAGFDTVRADADLYTFSLEARLAYVIVPPPGDVGPFVEARLGAGLLLADAERNRVFAGNGVGTNILVTGDQTSAGFQLRPSLLVGYDDGPWQFGAELAYAYAWLDSDEPGDNFQQFQAGVFVRLTY